MSGAVFENITRESFDDPHDSMQLMQDVNTNIRGGLSCAFIPLVEANNPKCRNYVPCDPAQHVWFQSVDATNLYGFCMTQPLPTGDYQKVEVLQDDHALERLHKLIDDYTDDDERGYMLVVDFHVPEELHDKFEFAPASHRRVQMHELSKRQRAVKFNRLSKEKQQKALETMKMPLSYQNGCEKLVPDLGHRTQGLHIAHAKLLKDLGVKFTAVHRIWSFKTTLKLMVNAMSLQKAEGAR